MARYMLIMRETEEARAASENIDFDEMVETMGKYNDELAEAGILLAFNGYYIIDVASMQEAINWAKRMPLTAGTRTEIRGMPSMEEYMTENGLVEQAQNEPVQTAQP
jgi:hypothetical protein